MKGGALCSFYAINQFVRWNLHRTTAVTNCNSKTILIATCRRPSVEARIDGGAVSSNGRVLLLRQIERKLGLCKAVADRLENARQKGVRHCSGVETMNCGSVGPSWDCCPITISFAGKATLVAADTATIETSTRTWSKLRRTFSTTDCAVSGDPQGLLSLLRI